MSTGSAALSKLTLNPPKFLVLTIPLPSRDEQRRLIGTVDQLDTQINEARTLQVQASAESPLLLKAALHRIASQLRATGQLGHVLSGKPRNGWSAKCDNADEGIPVLSLGAVTGFRYRQTEFKRTSLYATEDGHFWLRPGDLLITRSNTPELVGHAAIYNGNPAPCIYPDLMMRLPLKLEVVDPIFAWYWLQSPLVRAFIFQNAKGTSPTMKKISQDVVIAIPFPASLSLREQRRIVGELDTLQMEVDALRRFQSETTAELDALIPSILSKAFRGEL